MSHEKKQLVHCDVESCTHHAENGSCELPVISIAPRCNCSTGQCDESECSSYQKKP